MMSKTLAALVILGSLLSVPALAAISECSSLTVAVDERSGKGPAQHFYGDNAEDEGLFVRFMGTCHASRGESCSFPITASFDYPLSKSARAGKPDALYPEASDCLADGSPAMSQARDRIEHELAPRFRGLRLPNSPRQEPRASIAVRAHFGSGSKR